jgi:hypothetical protein
VEIRIGIINTGRELNFETATSADDVRTQVAAALEQNSAHVSFTDVKGNSYIVPSRRLRRLTRCTSSSR